jgi:16S rRNA (cytosine967-C5)-methyltransferase
MTPSARIQAAIELLAEVIATPRPADGTASAYFRTRRFIGSKDRQAVSGRLWRIMREYHRLAWWIAQAGCEVNARTFVVADLMFEKECTLAEIHEIFSGGKYAPEPLSRDEKKLAAALQDKALESPDMPLREKTECPEWAFEPLQQALGDRFETEMRAMQTPAPLDLRVNILKTNRKDVLDQLREDGIDAHEGKVSPLCVRVLGRPQISQHFLFQEGFIEIQDQGSQMVAVMADAKPGEQVADFCAGAGGKTLAMGASMNNKGRIVALDVLGGRLNRAKERFRRAGLHNIETREMTSERDKFVKRHVGHFDLVLVDAPCSGTGTWRRDPDKRWRQLGPGLPALVPLQKDILESAHRMVKPGGRLVYATCSLLPEENDGQVEAFIAAHPEFTLKQDMHLSPAKDDTDGFFAAVMVKAVPPLPLAGVGRGEGKEP